MRGGGSSSVVYSASIEVKVEGSSGDPRQDESYAAKIADLIDKNLRPRPLMVQKSDAKRGAILPEGTDVLTRSGQAGLRWASIVWSQYGFLSATKPS